MAEAQGVWSNSGLPVEPAIIDEFDHGELEQIIALNGVEEPELTARVGAMPFGLRMALQIGGYIRMSGDGKPRFDVEVLPSFPEAIARAAGAIATGDHAG